MIIKNHSTFLLVLILISMAVSPAFALGEGNRNLLLIGVMGISPMIVLWHSRFDKMDVLLLLFLITIIVFPLVAHPETMRWSTVLYSVMFGVTFISYKQLLRQKHLTINSYIKLLKYLIYAYFLTLLIQQLCVLTGLPIFNVSNYFPSEPWKLNSLAAEPSHSSRIIALLMYAYIVAKETSKDCKYNFQSEIKKDKWLWISFVWSMVTMGSGTAFLFLFLLLIKFIRFKNLLPILVVFIVTVVLINVFEIKAFERTYETAKATITLDETSILKADHSAAVRIVPFIITTKMLSVDTLDSWFGHGIDYVSTWMYLKLPGIYEGGSGGGLVTFALDYGLISAVIFLFFSFNTTFNSKDYFSILFWFLLIFMNGVNNQMVWLCMILLFTNKHFIKIKY